MSGVADAYARAWLELALEKGKVEDSLAFFKGVKDGFNEHLYLLKHPKLKSSDVLALFQGFTDDAFFIALIKNVLDQKRMPELLNIIDAFFELHQTLNRTKVLNVISAIPLQDEAIKAIKKSFSEYQEIEINVTIDPKIIGGLKIAYDDKVFDASSQSLLNRLKQTISR